MNYTERLQKQLQEHIEETVVVKLVSPFLGPESDFPQKVEIVHGGQRFEQARLAAIKRQADLADLEGDARERFVDNLTTLGKPKPEMTHAWNEMLLETLEYSGIVRRIGWCGPKFVSKSRAKKWIDGTEPIENHGERVDPPASVEVFEKEPESWLPVNLPPLLALTIGQKREMQTLKAAEEWRDESVKNLSESAKETKAKAREEFKGTAEEFENEFPTMFGGEHHAAIQILIEQAKKITFEKRVPMFVIPAETFLKEHQVDDQEVIWRLFKESPADVLEIYRARFHWEQNRRSEREELAKNS